ncbi:hypothetical protein BRC79_09410 [Halobacteriales archaeon QH_8_67_27]|nr:MAG: hypothetical protein BRC79_09410 [Halobacteriales archaeon QH_8_67_27]
MAAARPVRADELDDRLDLYRTLTPGDAELAPEDVTVLWEEMVAGDDLDVVACRDRQPVTTRVLSVRQPRRRASGPSEPFMSRCVLGWHVRGGVPTGF